MMPRELYWLRKVTDSDPKKMEARSSSMTATASLPSAELTARAGAGRGVSRPSSAKMAAVCSSPPWAKTKTGETSSNKTALRIFAAARGKCRVWFVMTHPDIARAVPRRATTAHIDRQHVFVQSFTRFSHTPSTSRRNGVGCLSRSITASRLRLEKQQREGTRAL